MFGNARGLHSVSRINFSKVGLNIPKNVSRILSSNKIYPDIPNLHNSSAQNDALYGAFFGFLIGDAVGSYLAYVTRGLEEFVPNALLMNGGGTYNLGSGQGSDQT